MVSPNRLRCVILAGVCAAASSASAFTPITNIFAGDNGAGGTTIQISNQLGLNLSAQAVIGPGFDTTLTETAAALNTFQAIINQGSDGRMTVSETGGLGVANSFSATRTFNTPAPNTFDDFSTYQFTITREDASILSVLQGSSVLITANGAPIATSGAGTGLLGAVNVLNLFGASDTASFTFTTGDVNNTAPVSINLSGALTASLLDSSFTFTGASLTAVPEPASFGLSLVALAGLAGWRSRRIFA